MRSSAKRRATRCPNSEFVSKIIIYLIVHFVVYVFVQVFLHLSNALLKLLRERLQLAQMIQFVL
jgi:hypothetical protein